MPSSLVTRIRGFVRLSGMEISARAKHLSKFFKNNKRGRWSGRLDSNQRPHAPQACALPDCATSRPLSTAFSVSPAFEKGQDSEEFFMQIEQEFTLRARGRLTASDAFRCRRLFGATFAH